MATVPEIPTDRKPAKAFYASFHGVAGVLTRPDVHVLFLETESGSVVRLTDVDLPELVVNGEVASAMAQYIADMAAGGYARIACQRQEGRQ